MTEGSWLVPWHRSPSSRPTLLCLPPAGSGCGQFRPWQAAFGDRISVVGVQLPGRESRWRVPPPASVADAVAAVVEEVRALIGANHPLVVFGQSFGGLLGYEITRVLGESYGRWPTGLVVAACRPPHMWTGAGHGLASDDDALAKLFGGRALNNEIDDDSRELLMEVLRQDALLSMTYRDPGYAKVKCSLQVWGGVHDETVTADHLAGWQQYAVREFVQSQFRGGHWFPMEQQTLVLDALQQLFVKPGSQRGA